ncbi:MAG: carboxymuconolactone decarboxylase family protein [Pseudomonadota bacterium]
MAEFQIHTPDTAPDDAKPLLEDSLKSVGFIPNLHGVFAESPQALEAYKALTTIFTQTSLSKIEQNVVWMTINYEHECHYCIPAHTMIAKGAGVPDDEIENLREGRPLDDPKLDALRTFTRTMVDKRGNVADADIDAFMAAGFSKRNVLDVVVGMAHKVMSNYTNHFTHTEVDAPFAQFAWTPPSQRTAAE